MTTELRAMREQLEDVFEAIAGERVYQDQLWGPTETGGQHSVTEFLVFMRSYVEEGLQIESRMAAPKADEKVLHLVRKVAALAVACMEQNGIRLRGIVYPSREQLEDRRFGDHTTR